MKTKTKLIALLLCVALFAVTASGCASFAKLKNKFSSADISIEEQVVFDKKGIKITAFDYKDKQISLFVENSSDIDVTITSMNFMVNGFHSCNSIFHADVGAGKKAYESIVLLLNEYEKECIGTPGKIEIFFSAYDENYNNVFTDEKFQIRTSAYTDKDAEMNLPSKELVNSNGVKIDFIGVSENELLQTKEICFYIENNTDGNIAVSSDKVAINGIVMRYASLTENFHEGEKGMASFIVYDKDLEECKIDSIDTIELKFEACEIDCIDPMDHNKVEEVLVSTDTITINANK